ncbi:serine/threonine-protein kinase [Nocardia rhizosphaerae]|uniref:Serine/threonine-protein kinase n=1 Tax=Nocardia rhizosphaerae TaxID=1691571 RepID=A0ABV8KZT0_9NOCA
MTPADGMRMAPLGPDDPVRLGRHRLLAVLGRGGMGQVLLGQAPDGRLVAVKQIHRRLTGDPEFRARFRREVIASQQVTGAYTAGVLDHDAESESPWLASEYIPGPSLQDMVGEFGRLTVSGLKLLATGLAMALIEIHRAGLVHRDLKPSNVLLTNDGPRVIDFGIARALEDDITLTATGVMIGSPAYMSPEQAQCEPLSAASDVFSVGAMLAMAATGASPFDAASTPQVLYNVLYTTPDTTGLPAPIRALVDACLAKDPAARPTPEQLLDAASAIDAEPVWPVRIRRRIAECQAEAMRWASGSAATPAPADQPSSRRRQRLVPVVALVSALVLATVAFLGTGVDGTAVAMTDPPLALTDDEIRRLDACELMTPAVLGEIGTAVGELVPLGVTGCSIYYRDQADRKVYFTLETGITPGEMRTKQKLGSTIAWMPVLGRHREARICDRSVLSQSGLPIALTMTAQVPDGDGCAIAERALGAVVGRLAVNPPLRDYAADSAFLRDACDLIDAAATRALIGAVVWTETAHTCTVTGRDSSFWIAVDERTRPDSSNGGKVRPRRTIGEHEVYLDSEGASCRLIALIRPTRADKAEQVEANFFAAGLDGPSGCDAATELFAPVLAKLPAS